MLKAILGIDVSKLKLDVELVIGEKALKKKFDNNDKGFRLLQGWLTSCISNGRTQLDISVSMSVSHDPSSRSCARTTLSGSMTII